MIGSGDYISREAALAFQDELAVLLCKDVVTGDVMSATKDADLVKYLLSIPAADVRPVVRGKWEPSEKYKGYVSCSICHDCYVEPEWVTKLKWGFCPNCGADMRGEQDV